MPSLDDVFYQLMQIPPGAGGSGLDDALRLASQPASPINLDDLLNAGDPQSSLNFKGVMADTPRGPWDPGYKGPINFGPAGKGWDFADDNPSAPFAPDYKGPQPKTKGPSKSPSKMPKSKGGGKLGKALGWGALGGLSLLGLSQMGQGDPQSTAWSDEPLTEAKPGSNNPNNPGLSADDNILAARRLRELLRGKDPFASVGNLGASNDQEYAGYQRHLDKMLQQLSGEGFKFDKNKVFNTAFVNKNAKDKYKGNNPK